LSEQIRTYLKGITLAELLEKNHVQDVAQRQDQNAHQVIEIHRQHG